MEEGCTVITGQSTSRNPSCSDGTVSYVQAARGIWLIYTRRRPESGWRVEGLVSCWLLEVCTPMIVNQDKGINSLCKIQGGTKMKQRQTQQTWKKVTSLFLSHFLHLSVTCFPSYLPMLLMWSITQTCCTVIIRIFS